MNAIVRQPLSGDILTPRDSVRVIGRRHLLSGERTVREVAAGLSIVEILREVGADKHSAGVAVQLDGHPIETANFHRVRVKAGVTMTFFPRHAGGGNIWKTVLSAIVAITALIVAPWAAPLIATTFGISTGIATALIAGGILAAGSLLTNALFPVSQQSLAQAPTSVPLNSIQGAQNQSNPFGAVPVTLGRSLQSPYYATKPYTEIVGDDQYLRMVFCLGYGPLQIESLQIGNTPLSQFSDVETQIKQGFATDTPVSLYPESVDEVALQVLLDDPGDFSNVDNGPNRIWNSQQTADDTDRIGLDFTATEGMYQVNQSTGNYDPWGVPIAVRYRLVGATDWTDLGTPVDFSRSVSPVRYGIVITPPARGQYEVQCAKSRGNGGATVKDTVYWTAIRSFKNGAPISFPKPLALVALRIRATDQLSGTVNTFNCITTSLVKSYSGSGGVWNDNTASQNPADLFRYVLQGPANARPVDDADIDIDTLQDWWSYCDTNGFKYNEVVNSVVSVYSKLSDICSSARAVPTFNNGRWSVVWDQPDSPIVQFFTPRNSWGFQGQRTYAQQPNGWRIQFVNELNGFTQDEIRVYDDGFDASNATLFEQISFTGVTDPSLNWKLGRFQIAQARLRPEKISLNVGWEQLVCTRGDRVAVTHDVLLIGLASGRIKEVSGQVVTIDEAVTIEDGKTYAVQVRIAAQSSPLTFAVDTTPAGDYNTLTLVGDLSPISDEIAADGKFSKSCLFGFGETAQESAVYRVQEIQNQSDLAAVLTLVDDAPDISTADQGDIPAYNPNITIPPDPLTLAPRNLVYLEVIDGQGAAVRALVRLSWQVPRFGNITSFEIQQRDDDAGGAFQTVLTVAAPHTLADVPLISAGTWSFRVRCLFDDGTVSGWTSLLGLRLQGLSAAPANVTNLHIVSVDGQTVLDWTIVNDARILFYEVRKGTTWDTGLVVGDAVAQPPWVTTGDGTYFVAAYVLSPFGSRIYSVTPVSIAVAGSIISRNIIVSQDEQAIGWTGGLEGGVIDGSFIRTDPAKALAQPWATEIVGQLALAGLHIAIYLSSKIVDIGEANECRFWTLFEADGIQPGSDFLSQTDVLASQDILGVAPTRFIQAFPIWRFAADGAGDAFGESDIFAPTDVFTADVNWGEWVAVASGTRVARYFRTGMVLITSDANTNATGTKFSWFVDVPDRTDDYTDLDVPDTGLALTFYSGGYNATPAAGRAALPFKGGPNGATVPHVQRAIVGGIDGDEVKITNLTLAGCTVNVVNAGANVARSGVNLLVRGF